ncbi:alpha/beta hydrolase [Larkinella knui]|uniref:Alpha/beta hydrolase n=1 Tax=Larkinella knui TaxID=2025310 RepID=A0A3P1CNE4_9BACT|nr:alpha/beta hydrolase [Larkinella knui]RRB14832.1 alpha/beta hydrolase [Larkinella knui]
MKTTLAYMLALTVGLSSCAILRHCRESSRPRTGLVNANGMTLAYERFGSSKNEAILLIAGTNSQLTTWPTSFCDYLARRGYQVIRFDNRDVGLSTKLTQAGLPDFTAIGQALTQQKTPALPYTLDDMASDAAGLLDALHIEKAHVVGASMGGMIAQRLAYNHPERVLTLTSLMAGGGKAGFPLIAKPAALSGIPAPWPSTDTTGYIRREVKSLLALSGKADSLDSLRIQAAVEQDVRRSYYPAGLIRQGAASLAGFYAGRERQLQTIRVPTLVIHGSDDPLVTPEAGRDVASNVPNARFTLIEGMGHEIAPAYTIQLADLILSNLSRKP